MSKRKGVAMSEAVRLVDAGSEEMSRPPAVRATPPPLPPRAWIVVVTRQGHEFLAKRELEDQARKGKLGPGVEIYLPMRLADNGRNITVPKPFLPNYILVRVSANMAAWRGIFGTRGVKGVLGSKDGRCWGLRDQIVERIRSREEAGYVRLGLAPDAEVKTFQAGQPVKVDQLVDAIFTERVDARRALIVYSLFNGRDSSQVVDLRRLSEISK